MPNCCAGIFQSLHHAFGERVLERPLAVVGGDDVIDRGERALGHEHREPEIAEHAERLRARHLVDQVQPDEELSLSPRQRLRRCGDPKPCRRDFYP